MKSLFLIISFLAIFSYKSIAQETIKCDAYQFSYKLKGQSWSDWERCDLLTVLDFDDDVITIYSKTIQEYDIISYLGREIDDDGDTVFKFKCVDQDGDICTLRFINRTSGTKQLYIDFADIMWVYNIRVR